LNQPQTNTLALGLRELAKHPDFQERLRAEIHLTMRRSVGAEFAYDSMPLLNAFIKVKRLLEPEFDESFNFAHQEVLRLYPAEALSEQVATKDGFLPLTNEITTAAGDSINKVPIKKGQIVTMVFASYQRFHAVSNLYVH
jgi:cytochrome P450